MYQTDAYSATVQPSDEKSTLQKEVEDNEDIDCLMKTLLKQAILTIRWQLETVRSMNVMDAK